MKLYKTKKATVIFYEENYYLTSESWDSLINRNKLHDYLVAETKKLTPSDIAASLIEKELLPPIGSQEVWAAGVTYFRSKEARMDESKESGGATFYDKVYDADRPELFFKSTAERVVGHGGYVHIRKDSTWNVPEPELTLFISSVGTIEGYTIGNDMSSRSIEGENPLYLPQAKTYDGSAALGPCLYIPESPIPSTTGIHLFISRQGKKVFTGDATLSQMKRSLPELASWLTKETSFPPGVFLMTGTCLVPPDGFTLQASDVVTITIDDIGTLTNTVA